MSREEPQGLGSALNGTQKTVDRNPFRNANLLNGLATPRGANPFSAAASNQTIKSKANRPASLPVFESEEIATSSTTARRQYKDSKNSGGPVLQQNTGTVINVERGNVVSGTHFGPVTQTIEEFPVLRNLPVHPDISGLLSDYFPNSRGDDEARILQWIDSNHPPELVLCVLGKVGVGKSTLAKQLAKRLRQDGRLAAEVFLGFALPDWSVELVVRMIAGQLCGTFEVLTRTISEAIRVDVGPSVSLETRIQKFILEPIRSLRLPGPLVVLLDALDQWAPHPILTKALSCLTTETHLIRFIVLGRPGLEDRFQNVSSKRYDLLEVSKTVMGDYLRDQFEQVQWEYGRKPSAHTIEQLVNKANGLFIWSSVLCSLLGDVLSCPNPHDTVAAILQSQKSIDENDILANLYCEVISLRFPKPDHKAKLKVFLGAVLVLQEPLPVAAFAALVSMEPAVVRRIEAHLGALQTGRAQETQDTIHPASSTFHLSLLEYLQGPDTPPHLAFPIDIVISHSQLGQACLEHLRRLLPTPQSSSIPPLQRYAMRYWPIHVAHGALTVPATTDVEWKATPHCAILESLSIPQWNQWATFYLHAVCPGTPQGLSIGELAEPQVLYPRGRKRSFACASIRALWSKLFHKPSYRASVPLEHENPHHLISRVVESLLYGSRASAGTPDVIALAEVAVQLRLQSSDAWLNLGRAYKEAAKISASSELVENAVRACRYAADLGGNANHQAHRTLASCLWLRFSRFGSREDLDEAISLDRAVLLLTPPGHPDRALSLNDLASSLQSHFDHTGATESLDEALVLHREALALWPPGHPDRAISLNNLAGSLRSHFDHTGMTESLDEATVLHREALALRPRGHPERAWSLNNLAVTLSSHFDHTGLAVSLEEAIVLYREALSLRLLGHPDRALALNNLANSLCSHFALTGTSDSLDEAIVLHREALSLRPPGHPNRAKSLYNLSNSLCYHFRLTSTAESLDEAIVLHREAVSLWPPGHPYRASSLNSLAGSLRSHFGLTGAAESLDEAIVLHREALFLRPPGHPNRAQSLHNLSISLYSDFDLTGTAESLDEAIVLRRETLSLYPPGHPRRATFFRNLASALQASYRLTGNVDSLNEATALLPPGKQPTP